MAMTKRSPIATFPMAFFVATLILNLVCFLAFSWYVWKSSSEFELTEKRGFRLYELSTTITQLGEISTMSARMAATTGNLSWEKYYKDIEPQINNAIKAASSLAPDLYLSSRGRAVINARSQLVEMEKKAFDLVRRGSSNRAMKLPSDEQFKTAESLLFSRDYEELKNTYASEIAQISGVSHERARVAIQAHRMLGFWAFTSVVLSMPILLFVWYAALKKVRSYITRRNEAEEALMESERKFRNLVTEINDGFFIADRNGIITFANKAYAGIVGYKDPEELIGRPLLEFIDPETRKGIARRFLDGIDAGEFNGSLESAIYKKDGTKAFIQINPVIHMEGRSIAGFRGISLDITERKLYEERLRKSHEDLSLLYDISSVISQTIDMEELCASILKSITELSMFESEKEGGIFIIEEDEMKLVSHTGHSEFFLELHKNLKVGDCLCGLAAKTGEVIVSKSSTDDSRHTIKYAGMTPHGYIILPLKARGKVIGVIYLFMPLGFDIGERRMNLLSAIGNQVGVALDNSMLYEETKRSALHDPLTGLANRRMMEMIFKRTLEEVKRYERPFSIIMLDVDHFKKYNDTKGHTAGDEALVNVSKVLIKATRGVDLVSRYGGEEFLILLPETGLEGTIILAERIRESMEEDTDVTVSIGIATCSKEIKDEEDFINRADAALYQAKNNGRNRVEIAP